jgi:hypothetical protein
LPEPGQIDIEGRLDHGLIIIPDPRTQSGYPLTNASRRFLLWMTDGTEPSTRSGRTAYPSPSMRPAA